MGVGRLDGLRVSTDAPQASRACSGHGAALFERLAVQARRVLVAAAPGAGSTVMASGVSRTTAASPGSSGVGDGHRAGGVGADGVHAEPEAVHGTGGGAADDADLHDAAGLLGDGRPGEGAVEGDEVAVAEQAERGGGGSRGRPSSQRVGGSAPGESRLSP